MTINEGTYLGILTSFGSGTASSTKTPYIFLEFDVDSVEQDGEFVALPDPVKRTCYVYLSEKAW